VSQEYFSLVFIIIIRNVLLQKVYIQWYYLYLIIYLNIK